MSNLVGSFAGGGFMGIGPARYASYLEAFLSSGTGEVFADHFAALGGNSTGAIISALLACRISAKDVADLYSAMIPKAFANKNWRYRLIKSGPQYDDAEIVNELKKHFGDKTMADTDKPLYLTAYDAPTRSLRVYGPSDKDMPIWKAVRASMAAPTYFSSVDKRLVDCGLATNDPLLVILAMAALDGHISSKKIRAIDFVTSGKTPDTGLIDDSWSIITTAKKVILPAITAGNSTDVELVAKGWAKTVADLGGDLQTIRLCPNTPDYDMDDVSKAVDVSTIWTNYWVSTKSQVIPFAKEGIV